MPGAASCAFRRLPFFRRAELHACVPRFGKTDRDCLFARSCTVLAFADMMHFFANELAGLS
jgi:hypothetical protein